MIYGIPNPGSLCPHTGGAAQANILMTVDRNGVMTITAPPIAPAVVNAFLWLPANGCAACSLNR
jgi:hypothetical protein